MPEDETHEVELLDLNEDEKLLFLDVLGYGINDDGIVVAKGDGKPIECPYSKTDVVFEDASILPGSTTIMNTNALTLAAYLNEHPSFRFKA